MRGPETIGIKAAGDSLSTLIDRVITYGDEFVITRHKTAVAVLIDPGVLAALRAAVAGSES